jgi:hypothetical protein
VCGRSVDPVGEEHDFACSGSADLGDQSRYRAPGHRHTEVNLGQSEHRVSGGDAEVAGQGKREPAADDMAMQSRDRHYFAVCDGLAGAVADLRVVAAFPVAGAPESGWVSEIGACAKRAATPAEDNRLQIEPLLQTGVEIRHLQQHVVVEAVERLRAVQLDPQYRPVLVDCQHSMQPFVAAFAHHAARRDVTRSQFGGAISRDDIGSPAARKIVRVERNRLNLDGVEQRDKHFYRAPLGPLSL